jgi:hypothetical protein
MKKKINNKLKQTVQTMVELVIYGDCSPKDISDLIHYAYCQSHGPFVWQDYVDEIVNVCGRREEYVDKFIAILSAVGVIGYTRDCDLTELVSALRNLSDLKGTNS